MNATKRQIRFADHRGQTGVFKIFPAVWNFELAFRSFPRIRFNLLFSSPSRRVEGLGTVLAYVHSIPWILRVGRERVAEKQTSRFAPGTAAPSRSGTRDNRGNLSPYRFSLSRYWKLRFATRDRQAIPPFCPLLILCSMNCTAPPRFTTPTLWHFCARRGRILEERPFHQVAS